ncbi:MAG: hypothetical protein ABI923_06855 [bacterium]
MSSIFFAPQYFLLHPGAKLRRTHLQAELTQSVCAMAALSLRMARAVQINRLAPYRTEKLAGLRRLAEAKYSRGCFSLLGFGYSWLE